MLGHAYSLLKVTELDNHKLVCLRNPWGKGEWTGRWSDNSKEWTSRYKRLLNQKDADDGIFWMLYEDFCLHFKNVSYCRLMKSDGWISKAYSNKWVKNVSAGGTPNEETFPSNPQYRVTASQDCSCSVVLTQKDSNLAATGIYVISGTVSKANLKSRLRSRDIVAKVGSFTNTKNNSLEFELKQNEPVIIVPCTYKANTEGSFTLMIFAEKDFTVQEYNVNE